MRRHIVLVVGLIAFSYMGVAVTPLKTSIGRSFPEVAAAFSPPWFNFHAKYSTGEVLGFEIGMSREQFQRILSGYLGMASLVGTCGGGGGAARVQLGNEPEVLALTGRNIVCLWFDSRRLSLIVEFDKDRVRQIDMALVNTEVI